MLNKDLTCVCVAFRPKVGGEPYGAIQALGTSAQDFKLWISKRWKISINKSGTGGFALVSGLQPGHAGARARKGLVWP